MKPKCRTLRLSRVLDWMEALPTPPASPRAPCVAGLLPVGAGREMPIRFGADDALFGILSLPDQPAPDVPAMLLTNTSANPRWGNARIAVDLARSLAADGIPSLRMDAGGMGDAEPASGERGRPYADWSPRTCWPPSRNWSDAPAGRWRSWACAPVPITHSRRRAAIRGWPG